MTAQLDAAVALVDELWSEGATADVVTSAAAACAVPTDSLWEHLAAHIGAHLGLLTSPHLPTVLADRFLLGTDATAAAAVAPNPVCSAEALARIARRRRIDTRVVEAARNPKMPPAMLAALAKHDQRFLARAVADNPATPPETLRHLAKTTADADTRQNVAGNTSAPGDVLEWIAAGADMWAQFEAAMNPAATTRVLTTLARSSESFVADAARDRLTAAAGM